MFGTVMLKGAEICVCLYLYIPREQVKYCDNLDILLLARSGVCGCHGVRLVYFLKRLTYQQYQHAEDYF